MSLNIRGPVKADINGCENVLRSLPDWFGIEKALIQYLKDIENMPTFHASVNDKILGESHPDKRFYGETRKFYLSQDFFPLMEIADFWGKGLPTLFMAKHLCKGQNQENEMITIRAEKPDDQPGIQEVDASATATLRRTYRPSQKAIANKARIRKQTQRLVAVINDRVVGSVEYHITDQSLGIMGLGVHQDFRLLGVARSLFCALEAIASKEGVARIQLYTVKETGNVDIFKRLGFMVASEQEDEFSESDGFSKLTGVEMVMQLPFQGDCQ